MEIKQAIEIAHTKAEVLEIMGFTRQRLSQVLNKPESYELKLFYNAKFGKRRTRKPAKLEITRTELVNLILKNHKTKTDFYNEVFEKYGLSIYWTKKAVDYHNLEIDLLQKFKLMIKI